MARSSSAGAIPNLGSLDQSVSFLRYGSIMPVVLSTRLGSLRYHDALVGLGSLGRPDASPRKGLAHGVVVLSDRVARSDYLVLSGGEARSALDEDGALA